MASRVLLAATLAAIGAVVLREGSPALAAAGRHEEPSCLPAQHWYTAPAHAKPVRRTIHHAADWRWELPRNGTDEYRLRTSARGGCELVISHADGQEQLRSSFIYGECPRPLRTSVPKVIDWKSAPAAAREYTTRVHSHCHFMGNNPAILRIPDGHELRSSVPNAHYLVALNSYPFGTNTSVLNDTRLESETCPSEPKTTIGLYDREFKPLLVEPLRREHDLEFGTLSAQEALSERSEKFEESYSQGSRTRKSKVTWSGFEDIALLSYAGGFIATGQDYFAVQSEPSESNPFSNNAFIFPLRVEVVTKTGCAPRLYAAHQQSQERLIGSCEHSGCDSRDLYPFSTSHKNPSLFVDGDDLLFLDWIAPTEVGKITSLVSTHNAMDTADFWSLQSTNSEGRMCSSSVFTSQTPLSAHSEIEYTNVSELCYEQTSRGNLTNLTSQLFEELRSEQQEEQLDDLTQTQELVFKHGAKLLHGGKALIRLPELGGELLGLGHLFRGSASHQPTHFPHNFLNTHYTHFWFTLSAGRPFKLRRISREFCFRAMGPRTMSHADVKYLTNLSGFRPPFGGRSLDEAYEHDCEVVQFSSSFVREPSSDGGTSDTVVIGYGAQDNHPLVVELQVAEVLSMLKPIGR